ncbi:ubiquitin-conjugating enzyme [Colletotrichum abscissum]|uniref:Ubiquitin-conjugating enzyme n=1 Tax=Colletotrichum abscissum TaxID=1671311 RepID=A0A9P9XN81_9PEZI|nr:ubiquitin-conjugating enzyme [Colletotrichum abscissum]KAI3556934.1 ubiquitin-conjugating enzyme [Colletotrichum abscissum]KAK1501141.1 ubiquitin-conjugating enzyme [Colletotrichum abscissum]
MFALLSKWCQSGKIADHEKHSRLRRVQAHQPIARASNDIVARRSSRFLPRVAQHVKTVLAHGLVIHHRLKEPPSAAMEQVYHDKRACAATVLSVFPDICLQYLEETAAKVNHNADQTIDTILGSTEKGGSYPKASRRQKSLKRKREGSAEDDEEDEDVEKENILRLYAHPGRERETRKQYISRSEEILKHDFPQVIQKCVMKIFYDNACKLLPTYLAVDKALEDLKNGVQEGLPYGFALKKRPTPPSDRIFAGQKMDQLLQTATHEEKRVLEELVAARRVLRVTRNRLDAARFEAAREAANFEIAKATGSFTDCGCCYSEFALNRMVRCENGNHFFCLECARRNAETVVGLSKYEITCMSIDGCDSGFAHKERSKFINDQLSQALDRIESEANLRMAGIDGLETCPFCPYAAEYPPVDINKEFKCENPDCQVVSCRLCREETHIPRTCDEAAGDSAEGARRQIEEAMSSALIRKCNKCGMAFVKESGCNKMTCTKRGCRNVQCYVCSKSCDYAHFDDQARGGQKGNCPLFDDVNTRHNEEVQQAEAKARQDILERHPSMKAKEDLLKVNSGKLASAVSKNPPALRAAYGQQLPPQNPQAQIVPPGMNRVVGMPPANAVGPFQPQPMMPQPQAHAMVPPANVAAGVANQQLQRGPVQAQYPQGHNPNPMLNQQHRPIIGAAFPNAQHPRFPYLQPSPVPPPPAVQQGRPAVFHNPNPPRVLYQPAAQAVPMIAPHPPIIAPQPVNQVVQAIAPPGQARLNNPNYLGFEEGWGPEYGEPRELKRHKFCDRNAQRLPDILARQNIDEKAGEQPQRPEEPAQQASAKMTAAQFLAHPNCGLAEFVAGKTNRDGSQVQHPAPVSRAAQRAIDAGHEFQRQLALHRDFYRGGANGIPGGSRDHPIKMD